TVLVGISTRTNKAGATALDALVGRHGYKVIPVEVRGCLHLKSACVALNDKRLLVNPAWLDMQSLGDLEMIHVPQDEPMAANLAPVGSSLCMAAVHVRTVDMIRRLGFDVRTIDLSEFAKAEGGGSCLSIVFTDAASP